MGISVTKLSREILREMIRDIIVEQFTIPKHSKHSGFEYYTESNDDPKIDEQGFVSPAASLRSDGDDIRASMGGDPYGDVDEPESFVYEKDEQEDKK